MSALENLRAAHLIADHAVETVGLPAPKAISVGNVDYPTSPAIELMAGSLSDLTDWALWLEAQITSEPYDGNIHHRVYGDALDQQICVFYVEKASDSLKAVS